MIHLKAISQQQTKAGPKYRFCHFFHLRLRDSPESADDGSEASDEALHTAKPADRVKRVGRNISAWLIHGFSVNFTFFHNF